MANWVSTSAERFHYGSWWGEDWRQILIQRRYNELTLGYTGDRTSPECLDLHNLAVRQIAYEIEHYKLWVPV